MAEAQITRSFWDRDDLEVVAYRNDGTPVDGVPFAEGEFAVALSSPGQATLKIPQDGANRIGELLQPWRGTIVFQKSGVPLYAGTVVKQRRVTGASPREFMLREWSGLLGRTWTTEATEFPKVTDPNWEHDASTIIHDRFAAAWHYQPDWIPACPTLPGPVGSVLGVEFLDQDDADSPGYISGDLKAVTEQGVDWLLGWDRGLKLDVLKFNPDDTPIDVQIGVDVAGGEVAVDTDPQATRVRVMAKTQEPATAPTGTPVKGDEMQLWKVKSYDTYQLAQQDADLQPFADDMLARLEAPLVDAGGLTLQGIRPEFKPGGLIRAWYPPDFVDEDNRQGYLLRITGVSYSLKSGGISTKLTCASTLNFLKPSARVSSTLNSAARPDLVTTLRDLISRVNRLEARR